MCSRESVLCTQTGSVFCKQGKKAFSPREGAAPLLFLYGHSPIRGNKQIWLFTTTRLAETEVCSRWSSLAVPDNVSDVAFSC